MATAVRTARSSTIWPILMKTTRAFMMMAPVTSSGPQAHLIGTHRMIRYSAPAGRGPAQNRSDTDQTR